jgi:hypothetical protein
MSEKNDEDIQNKDDEDIQNNDDLNKVLWKY